MSVHEKSLQTIDPLESMLSMVEIRCPKDDCGKLVLRYQRHESVAVLDLKCPRCKTQWVFDVRST